MDSFRRGRRLCNDIPWGGGVWAHGMGRAPPPSYEGGFPETGGAKDPKLQGNEDRLRFRVQNKHLRLIPKHDTPKR